MRRKVNVKASAFECLVDLSFLSPLSIKARLQKFDDQESDCVTLIGAREMATCLINVGFFWQSFDCLSDTVNFTSPTFD